MIASRNEEYAACLADPAVKAALAPESSLADPAGAFELGILSPLQGLAVPLGSPRLILIDALDESLAIQKSSTSLTIVDVLASRSERLPDWLRLVATTRREPAVLDRMRGLRSWELDAQDDRNVQDVNNYILTRLHEPAIESRARASSRSIPEIQRILIANSAGNFLYAQQILDGIERDLYSCETLDKLPPGLYGLYLAFFNRVFPDSQSYEFVKSILEVMTAAQEPLSETQLACATGKRDGDELAPLLRALRVYLRQISDGYTFYHKSISDWLTDPELRGTLHHINIRRGHERLAAICLAEYDAGSAAMSRFAVQHLPFHLENAGQWDDLHRVLCDLRFVEAKCATGMAHSLVADYLSACRTVSEPRFTSSEETEIEDFARFVASSAHLLSSNPSMTFQEAANLPGVSAVRDCAKADWEQRHETRPWLEWINRRRPSGQCLLTLTGHSRGVTAVAVSPDSNCIVSGCADGGIKIWDVRTGAELLSLRGHDEGINCCVFSPENARIASGSSDQRLCIWDAHSGELLHSLSSHQSPVATCAFSAFGDKLFSAADDGWISWDASNGAKLAEHAIRSASSPTCFSADGKFLASCKQNTAFIWDVASGELVRRIQTPNWVLACGFSSDGRQMFVSAASDRHSDLRILDIESGSEIFIIHDYLALRAALTQGRGWLVTSDSANLTGWSLAKTRKQTKRYERDNPDYVPDVVLTGHVGSITCCDFFSDGRRFVSGSLDKSLKIWDLNDQTYDSAPPEVKPGTPIGIKYCHSHPGGGFICVSSVHHLYYTYGHVSVWHPDSTGQPAVLYSYRPQHMAGMDCLSALSPHRKQLACHVAEEFKIFDTVSGAILAELNNVRVKHCAYSNDGLWLGVLYDSGFALWNTNTLERTTDKQCKWAAFALSPDGRNIAVADDGGALLILSRKTLRRVREIPGIFQGICQISYSHDGRFLAFASSKQLWLSRGPDFSFATVLNVQEDASFSFAFSPDDRLLAIASRHDEEILLWDTTQNQKHTELSTGSGGVNASAFSPDSRYLAWATLNSICIWDLSAQRQAGLFFAQTVVRALAWALDSRSIGFGDELGVFYALKLRGYH